MNSHVLHLNRCELCKRWGKKEMFHRVEIGEGVNTRGDWLKSYKTMCIPCYDALRMNKYIAEGLTPPSAEGDEERRMMTRTKEMQRIKELTELWYSCLVDHHKDRDCHFELEERWSYGDYPTYQIHHYGYVDDEWHSPSFQTSESAYQWFAAKLTAMIHKVATNLLESVERGEESGEHRKHFETILAKLTPPSPEGKTSQPKEIGGKE